MKDYSKYIGVFSDKATETIRDLMKEELMKLMEKFGLFDSTIQKIDKGMRYGLPVSYFSMLLLNKNNNDS